MLAPKITSIICVPHKFTSVSAIQAYIVHINPISRQMMHLQILSTKLLRVMLVTHLPIHLASGLALFWLHIGGRMRSHMFKNVVLNLSLVGQGQQNLTLTYA